MELTLVPTMHEDGTLTTNAADLIKEVNRELERFDYVVSTETYSLAKEDRKKLNKIAKQLADSRAALEERIFGTWKTDKANIMTMERAVKAASENLSNGIHAVEDAEKLKKAAALEAKWNELPGAEHYSFAAICDPKWLNKTAKEKQTLFEMEKVLSEIRAQEAQLKCVVEELPEVDQEIIMNHFYDSRDFIRCAQEANERRIAIRNAELRAQQAQNRPQAQNPVTQTPETIRTPKYQPAEETAQKALKRAFIVEGTVEQIKALGAFMAANGIRILDIAKDELTEGGLGHKLPYQRKGG